MLVNEQFLTNLTPGPDRRKNNGSDGSRIRNTAAFMIGIESLNQGLSDQQIPFPLPESEILDERSRAGVGVIFFAEFLTNEKAPRP